MSELRRYTTNYAVVCKCMELKLRTRSLEHRWICCYLLGLFYWYYTFGRTNATTGKDQLLVEVPLLALASRFAELVNIVSTYPSVWWRSPYENNVLTYVKSIRG